VVFGTDGVVSFVFLSFCLNSECWMLAGFLLWKGLFKLRSTVMAMIGNMFDRNDTFSSCSLLYAKTVLH